VAGANLSSNQYHFVKAGTVEGEYVAIAALTDVPIALQLGTPNAEGKIDEIVSFGLAECVANGAITFGALVAMDATGEVGPAATALNGAAIVGWAAGIASTSGDLVTIAFNVLGPCPRVGQYGTRIEPVILAQASATATLAQSGTKFVGANDAVITLPAVAVAPIGTYYELEGNTGGSVGVKFTPNASEAIGGNGFTTTGGQSLINTHATARVGDFVRIYNNGTMWIVEAIIGTWAKG
jgi:hypothetical protein